VAWALVVQGGPLLFTLDQGPRGEGDVEERAGRGRGRRGWRPADLARAWAVHARSVDPTQVGAQYASAGVRVHVAGRPGYPEPLATAAYPPAVAFSLGSLRALEHPRAVVVGTRSATHYGQEVAAELGAGLAGAGVSVVSGLAAGVDGAAHWGALAAAGAPPLAVVGTGLDVIYPSSHARLWARVAACGGLISESPLGAPAQPWRFPWRNRLLAALADVVVIVESHLAGGAMLTAEWAAQCGKPVLAVPGSVRSPASAGTNSLLAEGCPPARDVDDVLVALGLHLQGSRRGPVREGGRPQEGGGPSEGPDRAVWQAVDDQPTPTEAVLRRTGLGPGEVAAALGRLEAAGWILPGAGWWTRRRSPG
jgi:DNA processing protein